MAQSEPSGPTYIVQGQYVVINAPGEPVVEPPRPTEEKHRALCNAVNSQTLKDITAQITDDFNGARLTEPDFKADPQMIRVKDFFEGGFETIEDGLSIERTRDSAPPANGREEKSQLRREVGFHYDSSRSECENITKDALIDSFTKRHHHSDSNYVTALVASAGSGKTTLLRRITKETLNRCSIFEYENKPEVEQSHLKMVYYAELKNMADEERIKPSKLLFGGLYNNESDEDEAYKWLVDHQSEAILYFDGLDQATWNINESSKRKLRSYQEGSTSQIMYNLLSLKLLPRVKIVFTSREFKVSELPADARPSEIISLVGLKRSDAGKLFIALIKDKGSEIWSRIEKLSPRLLNLLSIPVFLVLTAAVMANYPKSRPPNTITELYNKILLCLPRVGCIQEKNRIMKVIKKLKPMAHQGMVDGRVVFYSSDLKSFGITVEEIRDLMIKVPGSNFLNCYLFEKDFGFFFCHQSLQEFLSASFVAEMKKEKFMQFNEQHLHKSRWSVVRTFVSGIIHDLSASELHDVKNRDDKQEAFGQSLISRIAKEKKAVQLLAAIYESNNDGLIQSLPDLPSLSWTRPGPDGAHMLSSIWAKSKIDNVNMWSYWLDDELLDIMSRNFKGRKIQVKRLNLRSNYFTARGLKPFLALLEVDELMIDSNLMKEFRYQDLDWNKIRVVNWGSSHDTEFQMIAEGQTIIIDGGVNGRFDKTPQTSDTDKKLTVACEDEYVSYLLDLVVFFQQKNFEVAIPGQVYATVTHLQKMEDYEMKAEISKMLLDCRPDKEVDSSLIESCVRKFKVSILDIVVSGKTSFDPSNFLISCAETKTRVHLYCNLDNINDVNKLDSVIAGIQAENLRLRIGVLSDVSYDNVKAIIKKCEGKEVTLVCFKKEKESIMDHENEIVKPAQNEFNNVNGEIWLSQCLSSIGLCYKPSVEA